MNKSTQKIYKNSNYDEKPKKYRVSYDAHFESFDSLDSFIEYKGKQYKGFLALYFDYKFFEGNKEVLFAENDNPSIAGINIVFNKEKGYEIEVTPSSINYDKIVVSPNKEATLWLDLQTPVNIPFEDAVKLLIKYADKFDISNNKPAQNLSFYATEVNKPTD